ncbi:MAG: hypothetical protein R3221_02935 [Spongiibacter sp.]|nr:hypothetical protein [Spongiibacter sp.]
MKKKFWAVWRENGGGAPQKRHESMDSAQKEAARLARQEGDRYFVLEVVGIVAPVEIPVEYTAIDT